MRQRKLRRGRKPRALRTIDLAFHFDPDELRDADGKWTATPDSEFKSALSFKSFLDTKPNDAFRAGPGRGKNLIDDPNRLLNGPHDSLQAWGAYQLQGVYQALNKFLRDGDNSKLDRYWNNNWQGAFGNLSDLASNMNKAFDDYGMKTPAPMKTYRGLAQDDVDWANVLKVGKTYTDKGVISTAPDPDEVGGFLDPAETGTRGAPGHAVILEIHIPAGTSVLGSMNGTNEMMLRPGTRFRIVSKGTIDVKNTMDGPKAKYTKFVVQVMQ